jgi:hypothetical protein
MKGENIEMTCSTNEVMRNLEERPLQRGRGGWEDNMKMSFTLVPQR